MPLIKCKLPNHFHSRFLGWKCNLANDFSFKFFGTLFSKKKKFFGTHELALSEKRT